MLTWFLTPFNSGNGETLDVTDLLLKASLECYIIPKRRELEQVFVNFEKFRGGGLPVCAGAVDRTFMKARKPCVYKESYWCYKHYTSILVLACVDARGVFTSC